MANLNTDLISPEQAIEATVAAYNSKDAIENIKGLKASASEINNNIFRNSFKKGTYYEDFTSLDNYSLQTPSAGTYSIVSEETPFGNSYLDLVSTVDATIVSTKAMPDSISLLQKKYISFYIWVDSIDNFGNASFQFYSGAVTKRFTYSFRPYLLNGTSSWHHVKIKVSDLVAEGGILLTDLITGWRLVSYPATGKSVHFKFAGIVFDNIEKPAISFTFDDGQISDYSIAYNKMKEYGYKGTIFQISEAVGLTGRTSLAQIQEMYNAGWYFGIHGKDALNWVTETTPEQAENSIKVCRDYLYNNGLTRGLDICAYPQGKNNDDTQLSLDRLGIKYARSTNTGVNYYPYNDRRKIAGRGLSPTSATNKAYVDEAIAKGGHLVFICHELTPNAYKTAFNELIDYIFENYNEYMTTLPEWFESYEYINKEI